MWVFLLWEAVKYLDRYHKIKCFNVFHFSWSVLYFINAFFICRIDFFQRAVRASDKIFCMIMKKNSLSEIVKWLGNRQYWLLTKSILFLIFSWKYVDGIFINMEYFHEKANILTEQDLFPWTHTHFNLPIYIYIYIYVRVRTHVCVCVHVLMKNNFATL